MAVRQPDGSIKLKDGRVIYANSLVLAQDLCEVVPLCIPPPAWPFVSGGNGGGGFGGGGGGRGSKGDPGPVGGIGPIGPIGPPGLPNQVQDEGLNLPVQNTLNFIGNGVQVTDNPGAGATDVTINDLYAATRIVSLIPGDGTDLTIQAAINNLPAEGGTIFVKQGTYLIAATLTLPDKDVTIEFAAGALLTPDAALVNTLTIPNTLTMLRTYRFINFNAAGGAVAGQTLLIDNDANSYGVIEFHNPDIDGYNKVFYMKAGDVTYTRGTRIYVYGGCIMAPVMAGNEFIKTDIKPSVGPFAPFEAGLWLLGTWMGNESLSTGFWTMDAYCDLIIEEISFFPMIGANHGAGLDVWGTLYAYANTPGVDSWEFHGNIEYTVGDIMGLYGNVNFKFSGNGPIIHWVYFSGSTLTINATKAIIGWVTAGDIVPVSGVFIDVLAGADDCSIGAGQLYDAVTAAIRVAALRTKIIGVTFASTGVRKTILEVGAADFTLVTGCMRIASGGGFTIPGANSLVGADNIG